METKINSKAYWNERFSSGDWEEKGGRHQTAYFYELLYSLLPEHLKSEFNDSEKNFTVCDVGCAQGEGTALLQEQFENTVVTGIDIANEAIIKAKKAYPDISFENKLDKQYDILISSNVLEHFEDPFTHLQELFLHSRHYVVVLVPFEEFDRVAEHFYTFLYKDLALEYDDFNLIYLNYLIAQEPSIWEGKQHIFIFQKNADLPNLTLQHFGIEQMIKNREADIDIFKEETEKQKQLLAIQKAAYNTTKKALTQTQKELIETNTELQKTKTELKTLQQQFVPINNELYAIKQSRMWKLSKSYYALRDSTPGISHIYKTLRSVKHHGLKQTLSKVFSLSKHKYLKVIHAGQDEKKLKEILTTHQNKPIVILPGLVDWHIPLFQRPQHLAKNMAKQNILYFYCTGNGQFDNVDGFEEIIEGCYLTNRFDLVDQISDRKKIYDLSSTDNITDWNFIEDRLNAGHGIVYQYIDEISAELSGAAIPERTLEKHFNILKDERCIVIPSATKLENEVKAYRNKNYKLVTNGVEIKHFTRQTDYADYPEEIKAVADKQKPVIGYFGAFATWFDYELVVKLATQRPELEIVLLGWDYDGSIKKHKFEQYENITVLGPIQYPELPKYAACFDVSTIPFIINDITESTSPIKLFEYMAMGKPIVTTDMPECRKYKSVLIGKTHDAFMEKIDEALSLRRDDTYSKLLKKEALENSWESKAEDIVKMIANNLI